ncbi:MAG TPA: hypothetical protein VF957_04315 [Bradyrhizobium sp.]
MVATVAAENLDGGVDRQSRELAELLHVGVAFFTAARAFLIGRIIRVVRRHNGRSSLSETVTADLPRPVPQYGGLLRVILRLNWGRPLG